MGKLPWSERVNMLSINPHAATIEDIAKLAADASELTALRAEVEEKHKLNMEYANELLKLRMEYTNELLKLRAGVEKLRDAVEWAMKQRIEDWMADHDEKSFKAELLRRAGEER